MNNGGHRNSAKPLAPTHNIFSFPTFFSNRCLICFWMYFGSFWGSTFDDFLYLLHHFFEHEFCIVFSSMLIWFVISVLVFIWLPFPFAYATCETFKTIVFTMNLNEFTIQENMNFDNFNEFFRYQFWHWFLMSFGIDFGTILASLWHQIQCFVVIVFGNDFGYDLLIDFDKKMFPFLVPGICQNLYFF